MVDFVAGARVTGFVVVAFVVRRNAIKLFVALMENKDSAGSLEV